MAGNMRGGDASGTTRIDVSMGEAIPVASSSFEGNYADGIQKKSMPDTSMADLVQGYSSYGAGVGERK